MAKRPKKVIIVGLDGPIAPRVYRYCKEGKLPALAKVIDNGVWAENCLVPNPTLTPSNWLAIATGAWPSTNGVTDFMVHVPGEPLNRTYAGFDSRLVKTEYVWNAIARAGKKSIVVNYPVTWPPVVENGLQVGGASVDMNGWMGPVPGDSPNTHLSPIGIKSTAPTVVFRPGFAQHAAVGTSQLSILATLSYGRLFSRKDLSAKESLNAKRAAYASRALDPIPLEFKQPAGWSNVPAAKRALEADLVFAPSAPLYRMDTPVWKMLVLDTKGQGYDRVIVCDKKDARSPMASLAEGQWSSVITREFKTEAGPKKASFALKLLSLSKDAADLRLYHTAICALDGWAYPESLAAEIKSPNGLPHPADDWLGLDLGWFEAETVLELEEMRGQWLSDASTYLLKNKPWDLFAVVNHVPDHIYHSMSKLMEPALTKDEAEWRRHQDLELAFLQKADKFAGDVFACADPEETVFALVSDHGGKARNGPGHLDGVSKALEDAGLMVRDKSGGIDWSRTRAVPQRGIWVYVNLKGRDPNGIVEPGKEYRHVQDEIIQVLISYVEPTTGKRPILFAVRKEDARYMHYHGDRVGDVVYAVSEQFGDEHGVFLPTAEWGEIGSMKGLLAMSGPGIKKGLVLDRTVWCMDLVPTLCYLAGWPMPRNAEGAVLFQALEDPDPK